MSQTRHEQWEKDVLFPLLYPGKYSLPPRETTIMLLSADVDRVQDYVFESARLPEIRGASMLVEELNRWEPCTWKNPVETVGDVFRQEYLPRRAIIYNGGGSLLALLPDPDTARRVQSVIEALFPKHTGLVTTTCVIRKTTVGELLDGYGSAEFKPADVWALRREGSDWKRIVAAYELQPAVANDQGAVERVVKEARCFGQMVEYMSILLRRAKDQERAPLFYETLPHAQRCRSCGRRPASFMAQYAEGEELWPLCDPCWRKLKDRRERRIAWLYKRDGVEVEDEVEVKGDELALPSCYYDGLAANDVETANDLTEIGQVCQAREGYVGFIYADGDSAGKFMQAQRTPGAYRDASRKLQSATRNAVYESLAHFLRPTKAKPREQESGSDKPPIIHPFEIIAIGGDDVLLIVPADVALPLAVNICQLFARQLSDEGLSMSAGVVIAQSHTPVRALRNIARQLLKSAKRRAGEVRGQGGLDFLALLSQSMLRRNISDLRDTFPVKLPGEGAASHVRLSGAPYRVDEAARLLNLLRLMRHKSFPASQLHQLSAALRKGRERGSLYFLYQQARLRHRPYGEILKDIDKLWAFEITDPIPWQQVGQDAPEPDPDVGFISILPDLADLFGFVPTDENMLKLWDVVIEEADDANTD